MTDEPKLTEAQRETSPLTGDQYAALAWALVPEVGHRAPGVALTIGPVVARMIAAAEQTARAEGYREGWNDSERMARP